MVSSRSLSFPPHLLRINSGDMEAWKSPLPEDGQAGIFPSSAGSQVQLLRDTETGLPFLGWSHPCGAGVSAGRHPVPSATFPRWSHPCRGWVSR